VVNIETNERLQVVRRWVVGWSTAGHLALCSPYNFNQIHPNRLLRAAVETCAALTFCMTRWNATAARSIPHRRLAVAARVEFESKV
jgi:hypothetical protein